MNEIVERTLSSLQKFVLLFTLGGLLLCGSCVSTKKTTLLKDIKHSEYPSEYTGIMPENYQIQIHDNLYIRVSTVDPLMSQIFNSAPASGSMVSNDASINLVSYPVQIDGTVEMPYVGSIHVAGKTLSEAKESVEEVLVDYVTDASITVRLVNNYISVLGEVANPGLYPIYKDQVNVFQAISMAGDFLDHGNRREVKIVRQTQKGSVINEIDLSDKNIIHSEYYYIMPNDIIYAKPMKGKFYAYRESRISFFITLITAGISTFILIQNYLLLQQFR